MALAQKGIDVRQTGTHIAFRSFLQDSSGAIVTSGTTNLFLYEIQSDGTLKSYDFNDNTFKTTALTTENVTLTHRTGNNSGTNTGIWTYVLTTVSGFTVGGVYLARTKNTGASPTDQIREFQYGGAEGDLTVTAGATGIAYLQDDATLVKTQTVTAAAGVTFPASLASASDVTTTGQRILDQIEVQRGQHTVTGNTFYVDGVAGDDTTGDGSRALPYKTISKAESVAVSNNHDQIILLPNPAGGPTQIVETAPITITKNYLQIRGPGRDVEVTRSNDGIVFDIQANGVGLSGFRITTFGGATSDAVQVSNNADFVQLYRLWIENAHQDAVNVISGTHCEAISCNLFFAGRNAVTINSGSGATDHFLVRDCIIRDCVGTGIVVGGVSGIDASDGTIRENLIHNCTVGISVASGVVSTSITDNKMFGNTTQFYDAGTMTAQIDNMPGIILEIAALDTIVIPSTDSSSITVGLVYTSEGLPQTQLDNSELGVFILDLETFTYVTTARAFMDPGCNTPLPDMTDQVLFSTSVGWQKTVAGDDVGTFSFFFKLNAADTPKKYAIVIGASIGRIKTIKGSLINLITNNASTLDLTQVIPTSNTPNSVGDCLNAARGQGFGVWKMVGSSLTIFAPDGTTPIRTFTLDSTTNPLQRV